MEEQDERRNVDNGSERQKQVKEETLLKFLDSMDGYLSLLDSLSSALRQYFDVFINEEHVQVSRSWCDDSFQGWLELASARHSMGASRISCVLLDLKVHSAATTLEVSGQDDESIGSKPSFVLHKWVSSDNKECTSGEGKRGEDKLQMKSEGQQLRHGNNSKFSEENAPAKNGTEVVLDDQVQKQRKKSLSMFGGLVSPKLRSAQLSFETALETIVEIANFRSTMLSTYDEVHKELEGTKG